MKFRKYLIDKRLSLLLYFFMCFILLLLMMAFKAETSMLIAVTVILSGFGGAVLLINFFRKKRFYDEITNNLEQLDKKYLVLETINTPEFYEGELVYQFLYEINKSMLERIGEYEFSINDFKDYVEMWIHEIKIPLSSLSLMVHNHRDIFDKRINQQIKRLDNYVEQVLYYVRSENAEKDYLIKENSLNDIVSNVVMKNKDDLLERNIELIVNDVDKIILTDSKWLEFILNQILNNSIKYIDETGSACIRIQAHGEGTEKTTLTIYDNGIGIPEDDLKRVFEKSFTGKNGRTGVKSTGMGLYIAKKLCDKLGHGLMIESAEQEYTKVSMVFMRNPYFDVLK
ncbi:MAG: HAMP domain-containing histidine kinase [Lachnospiraceae bacterium]|nr:HAMP domain-containing histidine kinase [Lachnospiraceae bacterium]